MRISILLCLLLLLNSTLCLGQNTDSADLPLASVEVDPQIPTSKEVLRYSWGEDVSSHFQIETYLKRIAQAAPDRSKLVKYGESYEGRSLNYLVISSAKNLSRIDEIQSNNLQLADPNTQAETARKIAGANPGVVWLAYAVHGNEISPSDAALVTAYHLLADQSEATKQILNNLVVIIDPLQNPDGRDRFVNVFRETRGIFSQSFPLANEHTERWPSGRSNHYWFDMNRDWFRHSQQEVQAKVAAYLDWQPQIYVDAHEMGANSSYYFPPAADPKNPYLMPAQLDWFGKLGKHQAGWFDRFGFGYVTREIFDAFYPGYGSEWPTLQGGLGVLWEQASARGAIVDREDETQLSYKDGVRNHYVSGIATLEFASQNREGLLQQFRRAKVSAAEEGSEGKVQHYFLSTSRPNRSAELGHMLERNGIEVDRLEQSLSVECNDSEQDTSAVRTIPAGSLHISVAQGNSRLIRALLERSVEMDDKFLRRQLERNQLRLPDEIYDVTAWSMPLAFDVNCYRTGEVEELQLAEWPAKPNSRELAIAKVAYLIPGTDGAIRMAAELLQKGLRLHVADEPFKIGGRRFNRGTLIAKVSENEPNLHGQLKAAMNAFDCEILSTDTAYVEEGAHMGGPDVHWVKPPKVLLVVQAPTNYSSGHTWYLFDQVLQYPTTRVSGRYFSSVDLSQFNTIVIPDGSFNADNGFTKGLAEKLQSWMQAGGTLITLRGGTSWAASEDASLLKNKILKRQVEVAKKSTEEKESETREVTPDNVPGAFLRANVFDRHWVTFGYKPTLNTFYTGRLVLSPTTETDGRSLVTFNKQDTLLSSGFCWPESLELLAETPYVVYRSVGRGHLVSFTDDPNFRAMYPSLQRLFINAAIFGAGH
ncbi:MAG: M14 family zinc carboxypeptidase [Planctomycetota bacterium]